MLKFRKQSGQSLIETIVAIYVLSFAFVASLGVAVYAFSRSTISGHEIVALNLAREGIDVVKMMRDSNWLYGDWSSDPSYNLQPCADIGGRPCFPRSHQGSFTLTPGGNKLAVFNPAANPKWSLSPMIVGSTNANLVYIAGSGYLHTAGTSSYARMLSVTFSSGSPHTNQNSNQLIVIRSAVVWRDKNCTYNGNPTFTGTEDLLAMATTCRVILEEHLTNWKDYK